MHRLFNKADRLGWVPVVTCYYFVRNTTSNITFSILPLKKNTFLLTSTFRNDFFPIKIAFYPLNAIRFRKFIKPHFSFIGWWIKTIYNKFYIW